MGGQITVQATQAAFVGRLLTAFYGEESDHYRQQGTEITFPCPFGTAPPRLEALLDELAPHLVAGTITLVPAVTLGYHCAPGGYRVCEAQCRHMHLPTASQLAVLRQQARDPQLTVGDLRAIIAQLIAWLALCV